MINSQFGNNSTSCQKSEIVFCAVLRQQKRWDFSSYSGQTPSELFRMHTLFFTGLSHVQFVKPEANFASPTFGVIFSTYVLVSDNAAMKFSF